MEQNHKLTLKGRCYFASYEIVSYVLIKGNGFIFAVKKNYLGFDPLGEIWK